MNAAMESRIRQSEPRQVCLSFDKLYQELLGSVLIHVMSHEA